MPWNENYYNQIIQLNTALDQKTLTPIAFRTYLDEVRDLGSYTSNDWQARWCKQVYTLGVKISKFNPLLFLNEFPALISNSTLEQTEVLEFIKSEIEFNLMPPAEVILILKRLRGRYPLNPEFVHSLGIIGRDINNLDSLKEKHEYFLQALKMNEANEKFIEDYVNSEMWIVGALLSEDGFEEATKRANDLYTDTRFVSFKIPVWGLLKRIEDYIAINKKMEMISTKAEETISKERVKLIEILGFFSAIMALIFSTVVSKPESSIDSFKFLIALGVMLNLFLLSMSYIFQKPGERFDKWKFISLLILLVTLVVLFILY